MFMVGCQPAAFPRTGEVAARGQVTGEVALQAVAYEPQRARLPDGREITSKVAFFPAIHGGVRVGLGGCEVGGVYGMTRVLVESRCGIFQERWGAPLSVALSGAWGLDYGPTFGAFGRIGLDMSVRLGPLRPIVDVYFSQSHELRYVEDSADPPIEGPLPGSKSVARDELRITVPVGLAIELTRPSERQIGYSLVLGAIPYRVLHVGACTEACKGISWTGDVGVGFTVGLELH